MQCVVQIYSCYKTDATTCAEDSRESVKTRILFKNPSNQTETQTETAVSDID